MFGLCFTRGLQVETVVGIDRPRGATTLSMTIYPGEVQIFVLGDTFASCLLALTLVLYHHPVWSYFNRTNTWNHMLETRNVSPVQVSDILDYLNILNNRRQSERKKKKKKLLTSCFSGSKGAGRKEIPLPEKILL